MLCSRCQAEMSSAAQFCSNCGAKPVEVCRHCRAENAPGHKFCGECGRPLPIAATGWLDAVRSTAPEAYTPKALAEKILTSRSALEGERKQVTVLFADLKDSMQLLADRDPEEARKILDPVLELMMEAVHRYEGTVNQVMGDGIMALFGAPLAHEDHGVRACYAALRMQESVRRHAEQVWPTEGIPIQIRIGLNSGEVVVRSISNDLRIDYTAVGQTTHLASRLEQMAKPGSILISSRTMNLTEGYLEIKPLGPIPVKGLDAPVDVFEVTGAGPARSRLQATAGRGLTPFVGRETELGQLSRAVERAKSEQGQFVVVVGEPGVGKSRLVWEFTHSHEADDLLTLESRAVSYGKTTPYLPVVDLLRGYFKIQSGDDEGEICRKVVGKILAIDEALRPTSAPLLALLDVPFEDLHWQALDPPQRRRRTLEAVKHVMLRESEIQPLLLVFEDLQWMDSESEALLDLLIESLPTTRLLLLVTCRPEYPDRWGDKTYRTQLRTDPLPPESAEQLLEALLGADARVQGLKPVLIDRTEGNPFFLEESVRTLVETGVLVGEHGAYLMGKTLEITDVPATVQAVLADRIDRLPPEVKHLLQSASVIGKDVPVVLLEGIATLSQQVLRSSLGHLQSSEFLYETGVLPRTEYTFKHSLTHEVAYRSLLQESRRALHARIVEVVEQLYSDRLADHVDRLAHHAFRGGAWGKALTYLRQAGSKALARSAYKEAVARFEQALVALGHLPESRDLLAQAIDLRFDLRNALLALGQHERTFDYLREAETLAKTLGDRRRTAWTYCYQTTYFWTAGEADRAIESGRRSLAMAEELGDTGLEVVANIGLGWAHHALADYRTAMECFTRTLASLQGDLIWERFGLAALPAVVSQTWLSWCLSERGEFAEAIVRGAEGVRIAEAVGHPYSRAIAFFGAGLPHLGQGDFHKATPALERGLELCRVFNIRAWFVPLASALGYAHALSGRVAEALPLLSEAVEEAVAIGLRFRQSLRVAWLSEALLLAGRVEDAIPLGAEAVELARRYKERAYEAHALRLRGEIAAQCHPPADNAETYFRDALDLATTLGMRPLIAHCHLGLGRVNRWTGTRTKGEQHLATAARLFREMDMRLWVERSETELNQWGSGNSEA